MESVNHRSVLSHQGVQLLQHPHQNPQHPHQNPQRRHREEIVIQEIATTIAYAEEAGVNVELNATLLLPHLNLRQHQHPQGRLLLPQKHQRQLLPVLEQDIASQQERNAAEV